MKYVAFLRSAYEGVSLRTGTPPTAVIVHPDSVQDVRDALAYLGYDVPVIADTEVSSGSISIMAGRKPVGN